MSIISKNTPINETMIIGGSDGKNGVMAIVRDAHDHWAGLTKEDQKQIFDWFLHNPEEGLYEDGFVLNYLDCRSSILLFAALCIYADLSYIFLDSCLNLE